MTPPTVSEDAAFSPAFWHWWKNGPQGRRVGSPAQCFEAWEAGSEFRASLDLKRIEEEHAAAIRAAETAAREQGRREGLEEAAKALVKHILDAIRRLARPAPAGEGTT